MSVQIAFVDTRLADWQMLAAGLDPSVEVILLDPEEDGVLQMAQALQDRSDIDAIHVFSHGSLGALYLGAITLTEDNVEDYASALTTVSVNPKLPTSDN